MEGDASNSRDHYMSEGDANGLVAYLDLFCTMLTEGQPEEVTNWIRQLEDKVGTSTAGCSLPAQPRVSVKRYQLVNQYAACAEGYSNQFANGCFFEPPSTWK